MTNKSQLHAKRLLNILMEGKVKKRKAPFLIALVVFIGTCTFFYKSYSDNKRDDNYFISRGATFNLNDIKKAKELKFDLTKMGSDDNHIIYYLSQDRISVSTLKMIEDAGFKLDSPNDKKENPLEQILLYRRYSPVFFDNIVTHNFKILNDLNFITSEKVIKKVSKICERHNPMACLKMAFYFKLIGKVEHSKSYAKRACYKPINKELCKIAETNF